MKKKLPKLGSDKEAEAFVAGADLTQYDLSDMRMVQFEFSPKDARINMRVPANLLKKVKTTAARRGIPYQRLIRQAIERAVAAPTSPGARKKRAG